MQRTGVNEALTNFSRKGNGVVSRSRYFLADLVLVFVASLLAVAVRNSSFEILEATHYHWIFAGVATASAAIIWPLAGVSRRSWRYFSVSDTVYLIGAVSGMVLVTLFVMFTINRSDTVARSVPLLQWALCLALLVLARIARRKIRGDHNRPVADPDAGMEYLLLIGFNRRTEVYLQCIEALYAHRVSVVGILDDDPKSRGLMLNGKPMIGHSRTLPATLKRFRNHGVEISRIVITMPENDLPASLRDTCAQLRSAGTVKIDYFEGLLGVADRKAPPVPVAVTEEEANSRRVGRGLRQFATARGRYLAAKRSLDFAAALSLILILSPAYLILAALVAIDLGVPVTFWQERPGLHRRPFRVYKFRTMRDAYDVDGNDVPEHLRLSGIGLALRRLRLDELPQLFNILVGNMSFVGPRPLLPVDQPDRPEVRLSMRPGLTGWAQVNGGRDLSISDKGALDFWYITHANLWVDAKIMFLTLKFVLTGEKPPQRQVLDEAHGLLNRRAAFRQMQSGI